MCANELLPAACRHSVCIEQQPLKEESTDECSNPKIFCVNRCALPC